MRISRIRATWWLALLLAAGCAAHRPQSISLTPPEELSADFPDRLSLAERAYSPYGPVDSILQSLEAAEEALATHPQHELASFLAARAAVWLLEFDEELTREQSVELARRGFGYAEAALSAHEEKVDYVFLSGAPLGQQLRLARSPGLVRMRKVRDYFERAVALDSSYDEGAPLRALGTMLVKAPPWPTGVGDEERGLELLRQGADLFPDHPASHLFLADALVAVGPVTEARAAYKKTLALCLEGRWGSVCDTYANRAEAALTGVR